MKQATHFLEEIKTLFKNSGTSASLLEAQLTKCCSWQIKQDVRSVYSRSGIIQLMILMKLMSIPSIHRLLRTELCQLIPFGKDLIYRVRKSCKLNWRNILLFNSNKCIQGIAMGEQETACWSKPCFILDDTDVLKRGKHIEGIGKVFSHVTGKYVLGFKCLNLAYWSGKHLLHVDFSLHAESGKSGTQGMTKKQLRKRYQKNRKEGTAGHTRERELFDKKSDCALRMLTRAIKKGFKASYILADSWFFSSKLAQLALNSSIGLISRPKFNKWKYVYADKPYTMGKLIRKVRYEKRKWNRDLRMHHVTVTVYFQGIPLKVFFYKEKKRGTKWQALLSTDRTLGAIQAYKTYQNRWAIEVSYKELKQHLNFGKCQARDFDAQIADTTITLAAYNHLSQVKAINAYESIGHLFDEVSRQQLSPTLMQRFWNEFYSVIKQIASLVNTNFDELLEHAIRSTTFLKDWQRINHLLTSET